MKNFARNGTYDIIRGFFKFIFNNYYDVKVEGLENIIDDKNGGIIVSNHNDPQEDWIYKKDKTGNLIFHTHSVDQLLIGAYLNSGQRFHAVVDRGHYKNMFRKELLETLQQIPATNNGLIEKSKKYLDGKEYILIFPEGNSGQKFKIKNEENRKIYPGFGKLVAELDNPNIFPVKIKINGKKDTLWPRFSSAEIKFGESFYYLDEFKEYPTCGRNLIDFSQISHPYFLNKQ